MTAFVIAAVAMLAATVPLGVTLWQSDLMEKIVAYEAVSSVAVMVLVLLPEAFGRPALFEFPILLAVLLFGSGLVFVNAVERWL